MLFDIRVLCPRQQPDQPRALWSDHLAQLRGRDQVLGIFEDHAHANLFGRIFFHQDLADELIEQGEDGVGVSRPGLRLADSLADLGVHQAQAVGIRSREEAESLAEVVPQHDVPRAEELRGQELGQVAVTGAIRLSARHQIVDVAVHHENAGRPGEIKLGEFAPPSPGTRPDGARRLPRQHRRERLGRLRRGRHGLSSFHHPPRVTPLKPRGADRVSGSPVRVPWPTATS